MLLAKMAFVVYNFFGHRFPNLELLFMLYGGLQEPGFLL